MNWLEVLKQIDWPDCALIIDFEAYFDSKYSLTKMSTIEYLTDPRFELHGFGVAELHQPFPPLDPHFVDTDRVDQWFNILQTNYGKNLERATVVVKNAMFDITLMQVHFGIVPRYIIDIDNLLRYYDARMSHKMKDVAPMCGLQPKGDTKQFMGKHTNEIDMEAMAEYGCNDIKIEAELLMKFLPLLTNPLMEIPLQMHTLKMYLDPKLYIDFDKADYLIEAMQGELDNAVKVTGQAIKAISGDISSAKLLADALGNEPLPVKPGKPTKNMIPITGPGMIPALAQNDDGMKSLLRHKDSIVRQLAIAKQAISSWPNHIKRIKSMVTQAECSNDRLRIPLLYHKAHTARWAGTQGINPHNFGGKGRMKILHPLIGQVRELLISDPFETLIIADSAQIEARALSWLAGQDDLTQGFASNEDIYSDLASELFRCHIHKPNETDPLPIAELLKVRRGFGKDAILGCGYGMGAKKFYERCLENDALRPLFESGKYTFAFIENIIKTYRTKYEKIPKLWGVVEKCFKWVIKHPSETLAMQPYNDAWDTVVNCISPEDAPESRLLFWNEDGTVIIQLPSGRCLRYRHARLKRSNNRSEIRWQYGALWGGSLIENIIQAIARDLLGWWILEIERQNIPVVLHVHDEIVAAVPDKEMLLASTAITLIMRSVPDWAKGLPVDVELGTGKKYEK